MKAHSTRTLKLAAAFALATGLTLVAGSGMSRPGPANAADSDEGRNRYFEIARGSRQVVSADILAVRIGEQRLAAQQDQDGQRYCQIPENLPLGLTSLQYEKDDQTTTAACSVYIVP